MIIHTIGFDDYKADMNTMAQLFQRESDKKDKEIKDLKTLIAAMIRTNKELRVGEFDLYVCSGSDIGEGYETYMDTTNHQWVYKWKGIEKQ